MAEKHDHSEGGKRLRAKLSDEKAERMAATFQKIKRAQDAERARFLESVDEAQAAIEPVVMQTLGQFDLFLGAIDRAADVVGVGGREIVAVGRLSCNQSGRLKESQPPNNAIPRMRIKSPARAGMEILRSGGTLVDIIPG